MTTPISRDSIERGLRSVACDPLNRLIRRTIAGVGTLGFDYDLAGRRSMAKDQGHRVRS
ncbi:MAG TPA: hypothetical protein VNE39_12835 [Planctomycetota bacterium]|nr:hypothetical protein [Planctomycetota bacterium]